MLKRETTAQSFAEWYRMGPYQHYVQERRLAGTAPARLLAVRQPAGDLSDPPTSDVVLALAKSRFRIRADYGAGRFETMADCGTCFIRPPNARAEILIDHPNTIRFLTFPADPLKQLITDFGRNLPNGLEFGRLHAAGFRNNFIQTVCDRLWDEAKSDDDHDQLYCDHLILILFSELTRLSKRSPTFARGGLTRSQMRQACDALIASLEQRQPAPGLAVLGGLVNLSPNHFCKAFTMTAGVPPHRWLSRYRMEKAKELMADPDRSLAEVALAVGFRSLSAFGIAFRRLVGKTPSEYRRRM